MILLLKKIFFQLKVVHFHVFFFSSFPGESWRFWRTLLCMTGGEFFPKKKKLSSFSFFISFLWSSSFSHQIGPWLFTKSWALPFIAKDSMEESCMVRLWSKFIPTMDRRDSIIWQEFRCHFFSKYQIFVALKMLDMCMYIIICVH